MKTLMLKSPVVPSLGRVGFCLLLHMMRFRFCLPLIFNLFQPFFNLFLYLLHTFFLFLFSFVTVHYETHTIPYIGQYDDEMLVLNIPVVE